MSAHFERLTLAHQHLRNNRPQQALDIIKALGPKGSSDADACAIASNCCILVRDYTRALFHAQRAVGLRPKDPNMHVIASIALAANKRFPESQAALHKAIALDPKNVKARLNLAAEALSKMNPGEALAHLDAVKDQPWDAGITSQYASILAALCRPNEAFAFLLEACAKFPNSDSILDVMCILSNYADRASIRDVWSAHDRYGALLDRLRPPERFNFRGTLEPSRKLRVGLVSGDFRGHSVSYFVRGFFASFDRSNFDLVAYSLTRHGDIVTDMLRGLATQWRELPEAIDIEIARAVEADGIDILVDLSGHTGGGQMTLFCYKPAPIAVTYCGYPNTTGVRQIDYRVVDGITDPPRGSWTAPATEPDAPDFDERCCERLVRLDPCFLNYTATVPCPPARTPRDEGAATPVVFGSFNSSRKISTHSIGLWAGVLGACPGSTLALKSIEFGSQEVVLNLRKQLEEAGIETSRVRILPPTKTFGEHLESYYDVDIGLDTFPYGGTTTTCEAIWMGVPVVTLTGDTHASRVGASLLSAVGCPELIAGSKESYASIAGALAADPRRLNAYHRDLRDRMSRSPLCDAPGFARRFEAALRAMWVEYCTMGGRANPREVQSER